MKKLIVDALQKASSMLQKRREKIHENKKRLKLDYIAREFSAYEINSTFLSAEFMSNIKSQYDQREINLDESHAFFKSLNAKGVIDFVNSIREKSRIDRDLLSADLKLHRFRANSAMFLNAMDGAVRSNVIRAAINEHTIRNSSNALLTSVAVYRGNYGLAAASAAQAARNKYNEGLHNGAIENLFKRYVFDVNVYRSGTEMNDLEIEYLLLAERLYNLNIIDRDVSGPLLFALVYDGGNCRAVPVEGDQYARAAAAEFVKRFGPYVLSKNEAALQLDRLVSTMGNVALVKQKRALNLVVLNQDLAWRVSIN